MAGNDFYCDEVLSGRTPVEIVESTESVLAFHHTRPNWSVHIVVIPKQHIRSLLDLTEHENDVLLEMMSVIRRVASEVIEHQGACRVITNLGQYQDSKHLHWHIVSGAQLDG